MFDKAIKSLSNTKFERQVDITVQKEKNNILNFNRKNLSESELSTGKKITPEYADSNKKTGNPNLLLTGSFYQNQALKVKGGVINFFNTDPNKKKVASLRKRYSAHIFGPQVEDREFIRDRIADRISFIIGKAFE